MKLLKSLQIIIKYSQILLGMLRVVISLKEQLIFVVCDGFVGNILKPQRVLRILLVKLSKNLKRSLISIAGAVLMRKVFKI